ncbi:hypothetical protein RJ640_001864 [Escallonia rubra]|uniref:TIR domain-containing protein n=1 Tax=Escallonia rubra TaxID=112253 RepID=A0AA88R6I6_9ASTE|nr:hypothetical protein RJ640_001864 [Escallonia rubra]
MAASSSSTPPRWMYDVFLSFRGEDTRKNFVDHLYYALDRHNIHTFKDDENLERGSSSRRIITYLTLNSAKLSIVYAGMAASSSSTPPHWVYDVFLSFRGEDTRKNFVDHLYEALVASNIRTFKDDEDLKRGSSISTELLKAIAGSRFAIVIFSQNYASSSWCLDELVKIIECKNLGGLTVLPVFYHVDPSDVRKQTGSFAKALEHHDRIKVSNWRQALTEAANTSGWDVEKEENGCLRSLPSSIFSLRSLRALRLSCCELLLKFPDIQRDMNNLREVFLNGTGIEELPSSIERLKNLGKLNLSGCRSLRSVPSSIVSLRSLGSLRLSGCELLLKFPDIQRDMDSLSKLLLDKTGIEELPSSIERLKNLATLDLSWCRSLRSLPSSIFSLRSLGSLRLSGCELFLKFPDIQRDMDSLSELLLDGTGIEELPSSIERLENLRTLDLSRCRSLRSLPSSIFSLRSLGSLRLSGCELLLKLPDIQRDMDSLSELLLDKTGIEELPSSIERLENLRTLDLSRCRSLRSVPSSIFSLRSLGSLRLSGCELLLKLPDIQRDMDSLSELLLDKTGIEELPSSIERLKNLVTLDLSWCRSLRSLPSSIFSLRSLRSLHLSGCELLLKFPDIQRDMDSLSELLLDGTGIEELPSSIERLKNLGTLNLSRCRSLRSLPSSIFSLQSLGSLRLSGCSELCELPGNLGNLRCLKELNAGETVVIQLPASIGLLKKLEILSFTGCKHSIIRQSWRSSVVLPSVSGLSSLVKLELSHQNLTALPSNIICLSSLLELDIGGNNFVSLPSSMVQIPRLEILWLVGCKKLQVLPELPPSIMELHANDCELLQGLAHPLSRYTRLRTVSFVDCSKLVCSLVDTLWQFLLQSASMLELKVAPADMGGKGVIAKGYIFVAKL